LPHFIPTVLQRQQPLIALDDSKLETLTEGRAGFSSIATIKRPGAVARNDCSNELMLMFHTYVHPAKELYKGLHIGRTRGRRSLDVASAADAFGTLAPAAHFLRLYRKCPALNLGPHTGCTPPGTSDKDLA
jgi:hypothetical protein